MSLFHRIQRFVSPNGVQNTDELLGLSVAYFGEMLKKSAEKQVFRPGNISLVHYNVLTSLSDQSPRSASSIAEIILGTPANFSAILSRMSKEGLIIRETYQKDKREVLVSWTPKGEKKFWEIRENFQNFFENTFQELSQQEKENMLPFIERMFEIV